MAKFYLENHYKIMNKVALYQLKLSEKFVIRCHFSLSLVHLNLYLRLTISCCREHLSMYNPYTCFKTIRLDRFYSILSHVFKI